MLKYDNLTNEKLRKLVMLSESINALPEEEAQTMINDMATLTEEEQNAMIESLKKEQQAITDAKAKKQLTPEEEMKEIKEKAAKVKEIKHEFETKVRQREEELDQEKSDKVAEEALKEI